MAAKGLSFAYLFFLFVLFLGFAFGTYPFYFLVAISLIMFFISYMVKKGVFSLSVCLLLWLPTLIVWFVGSFYSADAIKAFKYCALYFTVLFIADISSDEKMINAQLILNITVLFTSVHVAATIIGSINPDLIDKICSVLLSSEVVSSRKLFLELSGNGYPGLNNQTSWNAIYCSVFCACAFINLLFIKHRKIFWKLLWGMLLITGYLALFITSKRGLLIGSLLSSILVFTANINRISAKTKLTLLLSIIVMLLLVIPALYFVPQLSRGFTRTEAFFEAFKSGDVSSVSSGRVEIYMELLSRITPLTFFTGYGTISSDVILGIFAHNVFLQLLFENGIFGFFIFFTAITVTYYKTFSNMVKFKNTNSSIFVISCMSFYVQTMMLFYFLTGNPLYDAQMLIIYMFFCFIGFKVKDTPAIYLQDLVSKITHRKIAL